MSTAAVRTVDSAYLRWSDLRHVLATKPSTDHPDDAPLEVPSAETARAAFASFMDHGARDALLTVLVDHAVLNFHLTQYASERFLPADDVRSINCREWLAALDERCAAMHARLTVRSLSELSLLAVLAPRLPLLREISLILPEADFIRLPRPRPCLTKVPTPQQFLRALAAKQTVQDAAAVAGATRSLADRVISLTVRADSSNNHSNSAFDAVCAALPQLFPELVTVALPGTCAPSDGVLAIASLPALRSLDLSRLRTAPDIAPLGSTALTFLDVSDGRAAENMNTAASITTLTHLRMAGYPYPAQSFVGFAALTNLTSLDITRTALTDAQIASVAECPLRELNAARRRPNDWSFLSAITNLEVLDLSDTNFTNVGLLLGLGHLRHLDLSECGMMRDVELLELAKIQTLQVLDIRLSVRDASTVATLRETIPVVRAKLRSAVGLA